MRERCACGVSVNHEGTVASGGDYVCVMCGGSRVRLAPTRKELERRAKRTVKR